MDDNEFRERSDTALTKVAKWLEELDPDEVDYTTADGVVTIEFAAGAKFILSRQSQMKQMWLAAGSHGFHYNWDDSRGRVARRQGRSRALSTAGGDGFRATGPSGGFFHLIFADIRLI